MAATYGYGPLGRRVSKSGTGVAATWSIHSGDDGEAEERMRDSTFARQRQYTAANGLLRRYVPGPAIDRPIAMLDYSGGSEVLEFFHADKRGSVIAMGDAAGTRVEGPFVYGPYGSGAPVGGEPYKYTGRRLDAETGLYYYRARYYSPSLGRFLQTDPIGYGDDLNMYAYVGNDPTDMTDPTGMYGDCDSCWDAYDRSVQQMSPEERLNLAITVGTAAIPGGLEVRGAAGAGRVFWSGGRAAMEAAEAFARANGGRTLEMTLRGKLLTWLTNKFGFKNTERFWKWASESWAKGAKGEADAVLGEKVRPDSIWKKIEEPTLQKNGVKINEHPVSEVQSSSSGSRGASQGGGSPDFLRSGDNPNQSHLCTGSLIPTTGSCP